MIILSEILNEVAMNILTILALSFVMFWLGFWWPRTNRKTFIYRIRYFVLPYDNGDTLGYVLRRLTVGKRRSEIFSSNGKWSNSSINKKILFTEYQQIGACEASRMFPQAF